MLDTTPEKLTAVEDKSIPAPTTTRLNISPPRSPWIEFVLSFSTFGVYTGIWMFIRMREFKHLTQYPVTPWLWFFSVHAGIVQIFALPKFFKVLRQVEFRQNLTVSEGWSTWWMIITVLITFASNAVARQDESPIWMDISILFVWCMLFSVLQFPINRIKASMTDVEFTPRKTAQTIVECLIAIPLLCLILWLFFDSAIKPHLIEKIKEYQKGDIYINNERGLSLEFHSDGWTQVAVGTYAEEDLEDVVAEFSSPIEGNFYIIWDQGDEADNLAKYRQEDFLESLPDAKCNQIKKFATNELDINTYTTCTEKDASNHYNQYTTLVESKGIFYELFGYFQTTPGQHKRHIKSIKIMADGFEAIQ